MVLWEEEQHKQVVKQILKNLYNLPFINSAVGAACKEDYTIEHIT